MDLRKKVDNVGSAARRPQTSDVSCGTGRLSSTMTSDDTCMNTALFARVWVVPFLDRKQQPMTLPPFATMIDGQLLH